MKLALAVFMLMAGTGLVASERPRSIIHVSHLTPTEIGVTCANGADPTGVKTGDVLVISCGR